MLSGMANGVWPRSCARATAYVRVLVGSVVLGHAAGNLADLQRVREPRPVMVPFVIGKDLGLVFEPAKCLRMDYPIPIPLERSPVRTFFFRVNAPPAVLRKESVWSKEGSFSLFLGRTLYDHGVLSCYFSIEFFEEQR